MPYLRSAKLIGFIDGSTSAPAQMIASSTATGADQVPNPDYGRWCDQDQHLLSGLLSTMTEDVLRDVISANTSKEAWDILQRMFSSSTRARTVQIRVELATTKKHGFSAADYFRKIKNLAIEMAAADAPLRDDEVIAYLLAGLGADYDAFVTSMTTKCETLSLDDVYAYLMVFEACQSQHQAEMQLHTGSSVNYAGRGGSSRSRGRPDRGDLAVAPFPVQVTPEVIVAIPLVLHARFVAKRDTLSCVAGTAWTHPIMKIPLLQRWQPHLPTRLIPIGTVIPAPRIILQVILTGLLFVNVIMVVNKFKWATVQVCLFCTLVTLLLILPLVLLHCVTFCMYLKLLKIYCMSTNSLVIMMSFLNIIHGIFL